MAPRRIENTAICICILLFIISILKSISITVHGDEAYFWFNDYENGFVRRGLIGTLFSPVSSRLPSLYYMLATRFSALLGVAFIGREILNFISSSHSPLTTQERAAGACLFLTSPFLVQLIYHVGYPDGVISLFIIAGLFAVRRLALIWTLCLIVVAGLMHELAFIAFIPCIAFLCWWREDWRILHKAALAVVSIATIGLIARFADLPAEKLARILDRLAPQLTVAGISREQAVNWTGEILSRNFAASLHNMASTWHDHFLNGCIGIAYAGLPAILVLALGWPSLRAAMRQRRLSRLTKIVITTTYLAAGLSPVSILAIAWDLSRLTSFTTLTSMFIVMSLPSPHDQRDDPPAAARWRIGICVAASLVYLILPTYDLHFEGGRAIKTAFWASICPPCAAPGPLLLDYFNRDLPLSARQDLHTRSLTGG